MAELRVMEALREKRFELSGVVSRLEKPLAQHRGSLAGSVANAGLGKRGAEERCFQAATLNSPATGAACACMSRPPTL